MTDPIEANALVELEFELNRRDIMHCRTLILSTPASDEFIIPAPPPVEHAYSFKKGNRIDLFISLLSTKDIRHTLHIKTQVIRLGKEKNTNTLHLKKVGFSRKIPHPHFYTLRTATSVLLEPAIPTDKNTSVFAKVHSVSMNSMHISTPSPMEPGSLWKCSIDINGTLFNLTGSIENESEKTSLTANHPSIIHITETDSNDSLRIAEAIENAQKSYIQSRIGLSFHEVFSRSDIQDSLILEHLVPRSTYRVALDFLELAGWLVLVLACFDVVLAMPADVSFFDRFFGVQRTMAWDQKHLANVSFYLVAESAIFLSAFLLHQFIYYRGNTRSRWSLWIMSLLATLLFLAVRSHL